MNATEKPIIINGDDVKLLHFLIINAQCYLDSKRNYTQLDREVINFASDLMHQIVKNKR